MNVRRLVLLVLVFGVAAWLIRNGSRKSTSTDTKSAGTSAGSGNGAACVAAAEAANGKLHDAAMLAGRLPVDAGAWSSAQADVSSAISSAESACAGATGEADRNAADEVRTALSLMRSTLSSLDSQAHGQGSGGSASVQNQEQIDAHLDRARGLAK